MRHRKNNVKLGRKSAHVKELKASLVCNLIEEKRITTTLAKARVARCEAERMVTLGRKGTDPSSKPEERLAARRRAISKLHQEDRVTKLFTEIVPQLAGRNGGYTRIIKTDRRGDSAEMAILEWVGIAPADKKKKPAKAQEPVPETEKKSS